MNIQPQNYQLFKLIIRNFLIALKNGIFYDSAHPIFVHSLKSLFETLSKYYETKQSLALSFSQDNLYLDKVPFKNPESSFQEIAYYFHTRGILSMTIQKGVTMDELAQYLQMIKYDEKTIRQRGGLYNQVAQLPNIQIKEIDYSHLLSNEGSEELTTEEDVWNYLMNNPQLFTEQELPSSKMELFINFLSNAQKSSSLLNRVYKRALIKQADKELVQAIRMAMIQVCKHYEQFSGEREVREFKANLMDVISHLHTDLIGRLFNQAMHNGQMHDLANQITKDLSDSFIAGFIESLILNENSINENLLRIFDKLVPSQAKGESLTSILADNLFYKKKISPFSQTQLHDSIEELFRRRPESPFMQEMYKITVDSVLNKRMDSLVYMANLAPDIARFVHSIEQKKLLQEQSRLLLNLLWIEEDIEEYIKLCKQVRGFIPELIETEDFDSLHEVLLFFHDHVSPRFKFESRIDAEIRDISNVYQTSVIEQAAAKIPDCSPHVLEPISEILRLSETVAAPLLVNALLEQTGQSGRERLMAIMKTIRTGVSRELLKRLKSDSTPQMPVLFKLLNEIDPVKTHLIAREMLTQSDEHLIWQGLNRFQPVTSDEKELVYHLFKKQKDLEIKKRAAMILLQSQDSGLIDKLFHDARKSIFNITPLTLLIESCGQAKVPATLPNLKVEFFKKSVFMKKKRQDLRATILKAMMLIDRNKAFQFMTEGQKHKDMSIRSICRTMINQELMAEVGDEIGRIHS